MDRKRKTSISEDSSRSGRLKKTPKKDQIDSDRLDKLMSSEGRLQEKTIKRRKSILEDFKNNIASRGEDFDELINFER